MEELQETPVGFRFHPTDEELVFYYLERRVNGEPLPPNVVTDCEMYGDKEPWKIFDKDSNERFYVFTKLKRRSRGRIERAVGCGTWKGQNKKKIMDGDKHVGYKKMLVFEAKEQEGTANGHWIMHEFSLLEEKFNDFVLCDIRNTLKVNTCNHNPERRRIITNLIEEAPRENLVSSTIDTFTQVLENEENSIQEMIDELWEEHPAPINYVLPMGNGLDANL
ncbi:NAC transcription factor 32-like [Alnus glutinosa]|uniref:NAC transcription factor 32-like n=1 Tax=Alnus glutinosa TaxID=3517 RepID=UPI002D78BBDA|nr:NAC transcription factor 32-like [Alnus glutinosa]